MINLFIDKQYLLINDFMIMRHIYAFSYDLFYFFQMNYLIFYFFSCGNQSEIYLFYSTYAFYSIFLAFINILPENAEFKVFAIIVLANLELPNHISVVYLFLM